MKVDLEILININSLQSLYVTYQAAHERHNVSIKGDYMKLLILILSLISLNSFAMTKIALMKGRLYIPEGYDTNDLAEVTVQGGLPDSCHRNPTHEIVKEG
jgi:hypothetical protein